MTMKHAATLAIVLGLASLSLVGQTKSALDKATMEAYIRYSELYQPQVTITVDDPKPSTLLKDFYEIWVHLSYNGQRKDDMYYVSKDGANIVRGHCV